ncbi:MAG: hypothetical protein LBH42_09605 [Treponema sp.]|jgi:hypothetical protein|nr:hypothetical protein [Treponema sp.]
MKFSKLLLVLIPLPCVLALFLSCSKAEPRILYGIIELVYYQGRDIPEERYSFFILPEDDDGVENLDELYLYHDREGLRWLFTDEDWIKHEDDGKIWIGSRSIAMYDNVPLPRGQYRAVLVNKGGESTERRFTFDGPEIPPHAFPVLTINDGSYLVDSRYPINHLIGYDQQGSPIQNITITVNAGAIRDLRFQGAVRTIALWAEDPGYRISALTDAVLIR